MRALISGLVVSLMLGNSAWAQDEVTLTTTDGSVSVSGRLVDFDGEFIKVETDLGPLTLAAEDVYCEGQGCPPSGDEPANLIVSGSVELAGTLLPGIVDAFARDNDLTSQREISGDLDFVVLLHTADGDKVGSVSFRIGNDSSEDQDRELRPSEIAIREAPLSDTTTKASSTVIGRDALVVVGGPDGVVSAMTFNEVQAIIRGELDSWAELGGPDVPIALHMPSRVNSLSTLVQDFFGVAPDEVTTRAVRHLDQLDLLQAVSSDAYALGVTRYSEHGDTRLLTLEGSCGFRLQPTRTAIKTGDYPLALPIHLYADQRKLPPLGRDLIRYIGETQGQALVRLAGYLDLAAEETPLAMKGDRLLNAVSVAGTEVPVRELRRMSEVLRGGRHLSLSFRFQPGSSDLDSGSVDNVRRLARLVDAGHFDGKSVLVIGFSDGIGAADGNRRIGLGRAEAVAEAAKSVSNSLDDDSVDLVLESFGEAMPIACDDTEWGRELNRRVEVWVR